MYVWNREHIFQQRNECTFGTTFFSKNNNNTSETENTNPNENTSIQLAWGKNSTETEILRNYKKFQKPSIF